MDIKLNALDNLRNRLLDLTFRNKLISFKHNKSCLRIIDELPDQLVETLLSGSKMKFIPISEPKRRELVEEGYIDIDPVTKKDIISKKQPTAKEWAKVKGFNTSYRVPSDYSDDDEKHSDKNIQTVMYPFEMEATLKKVHQLAKTSINETGSNILYLSFGFLEWKDDTQDRSAVAPLFLLPVTIDKGHLNNEKKVYEYTISHSGDEVVENLSLKEKLKNDFGLALPELKEGDKPETYFEKIEELITDNQPEWKLERFITLGLLNFNRLLMYLDLDPENWPKGHGILDHPITSQLLGGSSNSESENSSQSFDFMDEYEIDELSNPHANYPLLFDADSSQHSAIVDAIDGKNLVIEGPPGTGKSQTISNLIGAALSQGKSVLFMSEKQAALNVVHEKLSNAGLGHFCLNLHSHKSQKKEILQSIGDRMATYKTFASPDGFLEEVERYEALKEDLSLYVNLVNSKWQETGLTIHEILNAAARYQKYLLTDFSGNVDFDILKINRYKEQLSSLLTLSEVALEHSNKTGNFYSHEWYGFGNSNFQTYEEDKLKQLINKLNLAFEDFMVYEKETFDEFGFISISSDFQKLPNEIVEFKKYLDSVTGVDFDNIHKVTFENINLLEESLSIFIKFNEQKLKVFEQNKELDINEQFSNGRLPEIPSEDINKLNDSLTVKGLHLALDSLEKTKLNLKDVNELLKKVQGVLKSEQLNLSMTGLQSLVNIVQIFKSITPQYISSRDLLLDKEEVNTLLPDLIKKVTLARGLRLDIEALYNVDTLPETDRLKSIHEILSQTSLFKWLKSDYREARKELLGYAKNKYIKLDQLHNGVAAVKGYRAEVLSINTGNFSDYLGGKLNGDKTDIETIESIVSWYANVRDIFGSGFGEIYKLRDQLKNLPDAEFHQLHGLLTGNNLDLIDTTIELINDFKQVFKDEFSDSEYGLLGSDGLIEGSISHVSNSIGFFNKISSLIDEESSIFSTLKVYKNINTYFRLRGDWDKVSETDVYFRKKGFVDGAKSINSITSTLSFMRLVLSGDENSNLTHFAKQGVPQDAFKRLKEHSDQLETLLQTSGQAFEIFKEFSNLNIEQWLNGRCRSRVNFISKNNEALDSSENLVFWVDYIRKVENIESKELEDVVGYFSDQGSFKDIFTTVKAHLYHALSIEIIKQDNILGGFSSAEHERKLEEYIKCDNKLKELQKQMIAHNIDVRAAYTAGRSSGKVSQLTERALLINESTKKKRHIPIRRLVERAPKSIQSIKPCFMMSPMSVSQYLKPGKMVFDLVVMDEASQIRPEDALSTIARGKQVIIVGDPKQLPPSNFFRKNNIDGDEDEVAAVEEQESILDSALGLLPLRRLRWHYRSRHQSLIAFSNYSFYDDNLVIFPSPEDANKTFGVHYSKINKGTFVDRRNIEEARVIALAVKNHMIKNPDETLGVVSMNVQQRDQIEREIEILAKEGDDQFSKIYEKNINLSKEAFFIKNLENVQGDERDVIYISMTYGPVTIGGQVFKRFGDINKDTGWRRLNVLFTRSKKRMHVFSSLSSSDVPNTGSRGVKALNAFLRYCETGQISRTNAENGRAPDSDFEISVMELLNSHGFECVPQVGEAGFFIDVAVRDPNKPGKFLMAIECDGATYHSSKSARDRDRLKQQILEGLGWNVKRIWSTDWFRNPTIAIAPIVRELNELKNQISEIDEHIDEDCDIERIVGEQDEISILDAKYAGLDVDIREKLTQFNNEVIIKEFPDTEDNKRLLSSFMLDALVEHQPWDKTEFLELIPEYIREHIDRYEGAKFLDDVLNIIASSMDD